MYELIYLYSCRLYYRERECVEMAKYTVSLSVQICRVKLVYLLKMNVILSYTVGILELSLNGLYFLLGYYYLYYFLGS